MRKLTPEQEAIVLARRLRWREGLLKVLALEFNRASNQRKLNCD